MKNIHQRTTTNHLFISHELIQGSLNNMIRDHFISLLRRVERIPKHVLIRIGAREKATLARVSHLEHPRGTTRSLRHIKSCIPITHIHTLVHRRETFWRDFPRFYQDYTYKKKKKIIKITLGSQCHHAELGHVGPTRTHMTGVHNNYCF